VLALHMHDVWWRLMDMSAENEFRKMSRVSQYGT